MTAGPFPTTTREELVAHFATEPARQAVQKWMDFIMRREWTETFYANLPKATLHYLPAGTVSFYGIRSGDETAVLPYVVFGMARKRTDAVEAWIAAHQGSLTCWSVPIGDGVDVYVHTLSDSLFIPVVKTGPVSPPVS